MVKAIDGGRWHRVARRLALLLLGAVAIAALAGCAADPHVDIADWTLRTPDGARVAVHAPQRLDDHLPKRVSVFHLEADVRLPDELRGRELTLTWEGVLAFATLVVEGERILPLSDTPFDRVRPSRRELVFRIPPGKVEGATLHLDLEVQHVDSWSARFALAPRLAAAPYGERQERLERFISQTAAEGVTAIFLLLAAAAGVSFVLDRRRTADGWYALLTLGIALNLSPLLGWTQLLDSRESVRIPIWTTTLVCISGIRFTRAYFGLPGARAAPVVLAALGAASLALCWAPFAELSLAPFVSVMDVVAMVFLAALLVRAARQPQRRLEALILMGAWAFVCVVALINNSYRARVVEYMPFAWLVLLVTQGVLLLRQHARQLRALNVALEGRVSDLEERNREVNRLNDELRHQIHDRSARLADALGRIGRLSVKKIEPPAIGTTMGDRYKVLAVLGQGGMGAVYEVERTTDARHFALKTLLQAGSGAWLARLAREAQAATAIVHPNVVRIVDIDVDASGVPFLVMELVKGEPLAAHPERFGDATFAREVVRQIAAGLAALHAAGIVHRDLKPENVLLEARADGSFCAKIADFGIARVDAATDAPLPESAREGVLGTDGFIALVERAGLTRTGVVLGTPMYMAPELATGVKDAQPSCDLWSLGVLAYTLARGKPPFDEPPVYAGSDCARIDTQAIAEPLRSVVARCLDPNPARRPSAGEIAVAL